MSIVKNMLQISNDDLREKIVEYMIVNDMSPETFAKHCGLGAGKTIKRFIEGDGEMIFMTRVKIINGLGK